MSATVDPVVDLNGCLLPYLEEVAGSRPDAGDDIGCAIPRLLEGNVRLQVLPVLVGAPDGRPEAAERQVERFVRLRDDDARLRRADGDLDGRGVSVALAVEDAACLFRAGENLDAGLARYERIERTAGPLACVTLTHKVENRFGGGCHTDVGLKDDGRSLLRFLSERPVAVDLAHASPRLARDVLERIERERLDLPVVASHCNFRAVWDHPSNLPDDVATEIARRGGLIGLNLIRAFVHPEDPRALLRHVEHGLALGGERALCFGADFFCSRVHPDRARQPFYFPEHAHAGRFPAILRELRPVLGREGCQAVAGGNAGAFLRRLWRECGAGA